MSYNIIAGAPQITTLAMRSGFAC